MIPILSVVKMREVTSNRIFCDLIKQAVEQHEDYQSCQESAHEVL